MKEDTPQIPRLILHIPHSSSNIPYMEGFVDNETLIWNEQLKLTDWDTDQLFYSMDDISLVPDFSRIFCDVERFAEWIGPDPHGDEVRVKVNNIPDNTKNFDFFDIVLPDYKIRGEVNSGFITDEVLQKIIRFIERNKKIILSYSACEITSDELVSHLKR